MKKNLFFIFIIAFLISCQSSTSKTTLITDNFGKDSKAKATFSAGVNNGICINCSQ